MSENEDRRALHSVVNSVVWAVGRTMEENGGSLDPRPGSQLAQEIADQGPYVGRTATPVADAYSVALMRLLSASEHFSALARLLAESEALGGADDMVPSFSAATLARTALENSARAWWLLDPDLDVRMRIARGLSDKIANLQQVARLPFDDLRAQARATMAEVIEDAEAVGFNVLRERGRIVGVEEARPGATAAIRAQRGTDGVLAYGDLSSVAHGDLSGMVSRMEEVEAISDREGIVIMRPNVTTSALATAIGIALLSFQEATDRRFLLYGWDTTHWNGWKKETGLLMVRLLRGGTGTPKAQQ